MNNIYLGEYKRYVVVPAILFIIIIGIIIAFPIKQGIDLSGGTSIVVRSNSPMSAELLKPVLEEKYDLTELQISSVSSPSGYGLFVQFSQNEDIASAQSLLEAAEDSLEQNPAQAKQLALESIAFSRKFAPVDDASNSSPQQAVASAKAALLEAEE
ncbi:MAG: hypothetical protein NUV67_04570, partial [archaeon]|nr:hypothetical protein [archaeon]